MPTLHLQLSRSPSEDQRNALARRLTDLTAEVLGKRAVVTAVLVDVLAAGHWYIDRQVIAVDASVPSTARLSIEITQGTNTSAQKTVFVQAAWNLLDEMLGPLAQASYVIVRELPAGDWGYAGHTQAARRAQTMPSVIEATDAL